MAVAADKVLERSRFWIVLPWVVLAIGSLASLLLFGVIRDAVESVAQLRFERQASDAKHNIEARINSYAEILNGLAALFTSQGSVSRIQFHRYVESLDLKHRYPGFDVVSYAAHVLAKDRKHFEESVRRDTSLEPGGYPNFAIRPPGERPEYYVLVYVEPMAGFEFAFGLDIGVNPAVKDSNALAAAVRLTRDSGKLTSSGLPIRIKAHKEHNEYVGLAMRLGVYHSGMPRDTIEQRRAAFFGSVGAGFNVENLMKGVVADETLQYLRFKLYDAGSAVNSPASSTEKKRSLLYDSDQQIQPTSARSDTDDPESVSTRVLPMEVGGRVWEVHFSAYKGAIIDRVDAMLPWLGLAGGLLSSLLLFGMFYSLASSRSRAVEIAREITKDLRESEAGLAEAQHIAHLGNWSLDSASWSMNWSAETYRIFGLDPQPMPVAYSDFLQRVCKDDRVALDEMLRCSIESGQDGEIEHRILLSDGSMRWAHTIVKPTRRDRQAVVPGTIMDITERKLAQEEVIESQTLLNEAQKLSHLGCWQWNILDGQVLWSDELYRIFGLDAGKFTPTLDNHLGMVHPEDKATIEHVIDTAARTGKGFSFEGRVVRPDGGIRHLLKQGNVVKDSAGRPAKVLVACLDVTEQRLAQELLQTSAEQLQALSRRLVDIQESERRQFSRELHDRIGQNLTALSINLDILKTGLVGDERLKFQSRLDDSAALLESTTGAIENVISELRPPMLDDYGLLPALQWYAHEFTSRTGIDVNVHGDEPMERLTPATEIALFRIAQEALNNIAKHAHADIVNVGLERLGAQWVLSVSDDGVGFDVESIAGSRKRPSLGMVTMRERTQAIGGHFEVRAASGRGTQVVVQIPS